MKFAHLSDLHLGKRIYEFSMVKDQEYILDKIIEIIIEEQVDGVLIAGDIYDKSVPSAEAVQLFDSFLTRLCWEKIPVYIISGNHDSTERLSFGSQMFKSSGIYISRIYDGDTKPVILEDEYGKANIYLLPFLKPAIVRHALEREDITGYQEAVEAAVDKLAINRDERNILVAHQFVTGAGRSDSEEVSVGGVDNIDRKVFEDFDYVALGHIHGSQHVGKETVRYCGTPLKYSFSEASHTKSVTIVELSEKGNVDIRTVPLVPLRDMRRIKGTYMEVTDRTAYTPQNRLDYVEVTLTDEQDIPNAMEKLRTVYPNLMCLKYDNKRTRENKEIQEVQEQEKKSEKEMFEDFYELVNHTPVTEEQERFLKDLIQKLKEDEV